MQAQAKCSDSADFGAECNGFLRSVDFKDFIPSLLGRKDSLNVSGKHRKCVYMVCKSIMQMKTTPQKMLFPSAMQKLNYQAMRLVYTVQCTHKFPLLSLSLANSFSLKYLSCHRIGSQFPPWCRIYRMYILCGVGGGGGGIFISRRNICMVVCTSGLRRHSGFSGPYVKSILPQGYDGWSSLLRRTK